MSAAPEHVASEHAESAASRRKRAVTLVRKLTEQLAELGVTAQVIGSLADGSFGKNSDIDLLVTGCPREQKYRIESMVEDMLQGYDFDVVYLDEIPQHRLERFTRNAVNARDLD